MAKISLVEDILKHDDEEIIEFLYDEMRDIRFLYNAVTAADKSAPEVLYSAAGSISIVHDVLKELNRRNKEKAL